MVDLKHLTSEYARMVCCCCCVHPVFFKVMTLKMLRIIRVFRVFRFSSALSRVALMRPGCQSRGGAHRCAMSSNSDMVFEAHRA